MENPFSLKEKIEGQTPNQFTIIKSITIILMYVSRLNKNLFFFFFLLHTNYLSQRWQHFTLSFLFSSPRMALSWLSSLSKRLPLGCSLNSFVRLPLSLFSSQRNSFFSLLVSPSIFSLPIGRTLRPKPSNSLQYYLFIRLFSYSLLNQEYITSLTRNKLSFHTKEQSFLHNKETQINFSFFLF